MCFGGRNVVNYRQLTISNETMNDTTRDATRLEIGYRAADGDQTASPLQSQTAGKRHRVTFPHLPRDQHDEQVLRLVATVHLTITARKLLIRFNRIT